jgi:hypothetical protein
MRDALTLIVLVAVVCLVVWLDQLRQRRNQPKGPWLDQRKDKR